MPPKSSKPSGLLRNGALLLVLVAGCPQPPPPPPGMTTPQGIFNAPANPTRVVPAPDTARAVTVLVPKTGGSVSATGADGSTFTLKVPNRALAEDTEITLTPLSSIGGLPFESLVAGVQVEPDGLELDALATLEVTPSRSVEPAAQMAFGYSSFEGAQELHLMPFAPGAPVRLSLLHFSGYGLAQASPAQVASQATKQTHDTRNRLLQALATSLGSGTPYEAFFRDYDAQVIQPRIALGAPTCTFGLTTLSEIFALERLVQLNGVSFTFSDGQPALFEKIAKVCIQEAMCRRGPLLSLLRTSALLGLEGTAVQASIEAEVARCDGGWKGGVRWTITGSSTQMDQTATTTFMKTIKREGSGAMTFIAPPGTVSEQGGGIPAESISASDSYTVDSVGTNTGSGCVTTQRARQTETGSVKKLRNDGTQYAFLVLQGTTYSLQLAGLEVPTKTVFVDELFERCTPATTDTLKNSTTMTQEGALSVILTETLTAPIDVAQPKRFVGNRTLKVLQPPDPELTITIDWDFTKP